MACRLLNTLQVDIDWRKVGIQQCFGVAIKKEGTDYVSHDAMGEGDSNFIVIGTI